MYGSVADATATPVATSPAMLVQPPTPTWRPCAPAHMSACATGAMATGATAIAAVVNSVAASFFIEYFLFAIPARRYYRPRRCGPLGIHWSDPRTARLTTTTDGSRPIVWPRRLRCRRRPITFGSVRLSRWWPRSLAGQAIALQIVVIAVVVLAGSALALFDASRDGDTAARQQVLGIATTLADSPSTATPIESGRAPEILQPVTEAVRKNTDIAFITIMAPDRTRFTHTDPSQIGGKYIGTIEPALRGETR